MLKKADIILILSIISAASVLFAVFVFMPKKAGCTVIVRQDNKVVYSAPLSDDNEVKLDGNTVVIKDNTVYMKEANCKNQICVRQGEIQRNGESIICLPNKVIIEITD